MNPAPLFGVVADVHVGNPKWRGGAMVEGVNRRGRDVLDTLHAAVRHANASGCRALFIAGDLFDSSRATPQLVDGVMDVLREAVTDVHIIVGNHDQESTGEGDHALGPLGHLPHVTVHEKPGRVLVGDTEVLLVPFQPSDARLYVAEAVAKLGTVKGNLAFVASGGRVRSRVVILHAGVVDSLTPAYLRTVPDAVELEPFAALCAAQEIDAAVLGNWHEHRTWNLNAGRSVQVAQVGALVPTDFRNLGLHAYGSVLMWDGRTLSRDVLAGPRFVVAKNLAEFDAALGAVRVTKGSGKEARVTAAAFPLYVRWDVDNPAELADASARVRAEVEAGLLAGGEASPTDNAARAQAREAAQTVRAAETLRGAVVAHVAGSPMPEGVQASEVERRALRYLGLGGAHA